MRAAGLIAALAALLVLAGQAQALIHQAPRHVDPVLAGEEAPGALELLLLYLALGEALAGFNFTQALENLGLVEGAYVPEAHRGLYERFNEMLEELIAEANETRSLIDEAREALERGEYGVVLELVEEGYRSLARANITALDLREASAVLIRLGLPGQGVEEFLGYVEESLEKLREELEELEREALELSQVPEGTRIELYVYPWSVWFNGSVTVWGVLESASGEGLQGRTVIIRAGTESYEAVTGFGGIYFARVRLALYEPTVYIYSEYIPSGADRGLYEYSRSSVKEVSVLYITPDVGIVMGRKSLLPGEETVVVVTGIRGLEASLLDPFKGPVRLDAEDGYSIYVLRVPVNASEGLYTVSVYTEPRGVIGPGSSSEEFVVYRLDLDYTVEYPGTVFTGLRYSIRVLVEQDVEYAVRAEPLGAGGGLVEVHSEGGLVEFRVPHRYMYTGLELRLHVEPLDYRYRPSTVDLDIRVYNLAMLTLALVIAAPIIAAAGRRTSKVRSPQAPELAEPRRAEATEELPGDLRGLFRALVGLLESATGVVFKASYTLREYLGLIRGALPQGLAGSVERVFRGLERLLYGPPGWPGERDLADSIRGLLRRLRELVRGP